MIRSLTIISMHCIHLLSVYMCDWSMLGQVRICATHNSKEQNMGKRHATSSDVHIIRGRSDNKVVDEKNKHAQANKLSAACRLVQ